MSRKINQVEPNISEEDIQKVNDYMSSGAWITEHALTKELEKKIADFVDRKYAIAVPNGTIAIYLSLLSAGLTKGKRVAVPNITMIATINAILWAGAEPVIIDLNERLCMSLKSLQAVEKLDGVIYVPLNGRTEDGIAIEEYCNEKDIILIESLKSDGIKIDKKYDNLYKILDSEMPTDIQVMINNNESASTILRIIEVIGQDELITLDEDTLFFIISALNQLNIDSIRNKILLKVLPLKV